MVFVAREQHESVFITIGEVAASCDLATIIDEDGIY
jgi:hypothetical protein